VQGFLPKGKKGPFSAPDNPLLQPLQPEKRPRNLRRLVVLDLLKKYA